jgi:hypothetical protein
MKKEPKSPPNRRKTEVAQESPEKPKIQMTSISDHSTPPPLLNTVNTPNLQPQKKVLPRGNGNPSFSPQAPTSPIISPVFFLPEGILNELGKGGDLEVECPFCSDTIFFRYEDIDVKKKASTRICSCDAIARISIQQSNRGIFSDLKLQNFDIASQVRKHKNTILDEYNNEIITYAFLNRAEK